MITSGAYPINDNIPCHPKFQAVERLIYHQRFAGYNTLLPISVAFLCRMALMVRFDFGLLQQ